MLSIASKLYSILSIRERKQALALLVMIILMGFFEMVGVASVVPFISILADPSIVERNAYLSFVFRFSKIDSTENFLFFVGAFVLAILVCSIAFRALTNFAIIRFTSMRSLSISSRLISGYLNQPYEWFLNRHSADLGKTILSEVDQAIRGAMLPLANLIAGLVAAIFICLLLFWTNPFLSLSVAIVLTLVYSLIYWLLRPKLQKISQERGRNKQIKYKIISEAFGGIKEIKIAGLEGTFFRYFQKPTNALAKADATNNLASSMPRYLLESISFGGILAISLYLMKTTGNLQSALPNLALYALAGYRLMPMMQQVYQSAISIRYSESAVDNLCKDFAERSLPTQSKSDVKYLLPLAEHIQLRNVSYVYPLAQRSSLSNVNLTIPLRHTVGFVGSTGSGKTTIVDIILGLLEPSSGQLLVDGNVVSSQNVRAWQRCLGYVPQSIYLADDTIAANIAFGVSKSEIDRAACERAAKISNIHDFIVNELPHGYETMIGERGVRLSGGQRQRLGIARAVYQMPDVLVLDEATSALDNVTEEFVMNNIRQLNKDMTIVLIAHRLATVKTCNTIFMLEQGELVAQGTFAELFDNNQKFRCLANAKSTDS